MAALLLGCLAGSAIISRNETAAGWWLNTAVGTIMSVLVVAGLAMAITALVQGRKSKATETTHLALLALFLNASVLILYFAGFAVWLAAGSGIR